MNKEKIISKIKSYITEKDIFKDMVENGSKSNKMKNKIIFFLNFYLILIIMIMPVCTMINLYVSNNIERFYLFPISFLPLVLLYAWDSSNSKIGTLLKIRTIRDFKNFKYNLLTKNYISLNLYKELSKKISQKDMHILSKEKITYNDLGITDYFITKDNGFLKMMEKKNAKIKRKEMLIFKEKKNKAESFVDSLYK